MNLNKYTFELKQFSNLNILKESEYMNENNKKLRESF